MQSKVRSWVEDFGGIKKLASALKIGEHQVRAWLRGDATPHTKNILRLIKLSNNKLTFETIVKETSRNK